MRKTIIIFSLFLFCISLYSQPNNFSWRERHNKTFNYISDAKNQKEQGPCGAFAVVAAVEAITQIYINKTSPMLDLSESFIYSENDTVNHCRGVGCGAVGVTSSLFFIKTNGIVDENCYKYPDEPLPPHNGDSTYRYCY